MFAVLSLFLPLALTATPANDYQLQESEDNTALVIVLFIGLLIAAAIVTWIITSRSKQEAGREATPRRAEPEAEPHAKPVRTPPVPEMAAREVAAPEVVKPEAAAWEEEPAPLAEPEPSALAPKPEAAVQAAEEAPAPPVAEPVAAPEAAAEAAAEAAPAPSAEPDDLRLIEGIGPKVSRALMDAGITTFAQVAASTPEHLEAVVTGAGVRIIPGAPATWPDQARFAAAGDWEGLERLQGSLRAGRRPD